MAQKDQDTIHIMGGTSSDLFLSCLKSEEVLDLRNVESGWQLRDLDNKLCSMKREVIIEIECPSVNPNEVCDAIWNTKQLAIKVFSCFLCVWFAMWNCFSRKHLIAKNVVVVQNIKSLSANSSLPNLCYELLYSPTQASVQGLNSHLIISVISDQLERIQFSGNRGDSANTL